MYRYFFKRIIDFICSFLGLVVLSPILIILILVLLIANKGYPFFLQKRPGKKGDLFSIIKFKTMRNLDPSSINDIHNPSRVTAVGKFIRNYSLDEILQLVNVLKGDMSLVGPRPLLTEYLPLYNEEQSQRHDVRPGITGLAQVMGRNSISWCEKFSYDVKYVKELSLILDIKILLLTVKKVFANDGINADDDKTMPVWKGN